MDERKDILGRLGCRVRQLRFEHRWSQMDLATRSGLHRNYIGHVERGEINLGLENIQNLAAAFELSVSELFAGV